MKKIATLFLHGLTAILPIALTLYAIYWLATTAESALGAAAIGRLLPTGWYKPGMGVLAGFLLTLAVGILLRIWLFRVVFRLGERILEKIPLVRSLYGSIRDLTSFFDKSQKKKFDTVVMVTVGDADTELMGLVTRDTFTDLPPGVGDEKTVAVYLPMSYQMGGFTIMTPKSRIRSIDMGVEDALQFVLTAGVSAEKQASPQPSPA